MNVEVMKLVGILLFRKKFFNNAFDATTTTTTTKCFFSFHIVWKTRRALNGPIRLCFAQHFLALLPSNVRQDEWMERNLMDFVRHQTEHATGDHFFVTKKQSTAALACVLNVIDAVEMSACHREEFVCTIIDLLWWHESIFG